MQIHHIVRALRDLYLILLGLSLETLGHETLSKLFDDPDIHDVPDLILKWDHVRPCVVHAGIFLFTLVPFAMGSIVHLQREYLDKSVVMTTDRGRPVLFEFFLLFIQGMLFITWAHLAVHTGYRFVWVFVLILSVDFFGALVLGMIDQRPNLQREPHWIQLNFFTALACGIGIYLLPRLSDKIDDDVVSVVILFASVARTGFDICLDWPFYFGNIPAASPKVPAKS